MKRFRSIMVILLLIYVLWLQNQNEELKEEIRDAKYRVEYCKIKHKVI